MKRKIVIAIVLAMIVATSLLALTSCNSEIDYVEKLYEKGYTQISVYDYEDSDGYIMICGTQGWGGPSGDILICNSQNKARTEYDRLKDELAESKYIWLYGRVVIYGNEEFVNDMTNK